MNTPNPNSHHRQGPSTSSVTRSTQWHEMPPTLSVEETATILDICSKHVYEMVQREELDVRKIGKRIVIPRWSLARFLGAEQELLESLRSNAQASHLPGGELATNGRRAVAA